MAAYDLLVQKPAQLAIPNTFNQSANNVLNSVRLAQQQKNEEDRLALDKTKEANRAQEANNLQALRDRTQLFAEGADARAKQARIDTNQGLEQALMAARNQLGGQFNFTDANRAAIENDIRFAKMTDDQKAQFWNDARTKMVGDIGKHTDPRLYERAIRAQYANTDATPEMIDQAVQNEMNRVYGVADSDLMKTLARSTVGGSSGGGLNRPPEFDNVRNYVDAADYVQQWSERADVEKGNGGWFDFGDTDLTEQNVSRYIASMRNKFGFNEVEALNALDTMRDGDTVDLDFNEVMNADINGNSVASQTLKKLYDVGNSMRQTRLAGTGVGGDNQSQALQVMQMINGSTRRGTTEAQRRDLLFTMLTERMGVAEAKKQTEELTESKVPKNVVEEVKNSPQPEGNSGLTKLLIGNREGGNVDALVNSLGAYAGNIGEELSSVGNTFSNEGLLGLLSRGYNNSPISGVLDSARQMIAPSAQEKIKSLERELSILNTDNPNGAGAKRAAAITKQIEEIMSSVPKKPVTDLDRVINSIPR